MVLQMANQYEEDTRIHYLKSQSNVNHEEVSLYIFRISKIKNLTIPSKDIE